MIARDVQQGTLIKVLIGDTIFVRQPVNAVYYRNTQLAARIRCFLDFLTVYMQQAV